MSDAIWLFFVVVMIYMMVRPDSPAALFVTEFTDGITALIKLTVSG